MADKIEFPLNDNVYLKRTREYIENEQYSLALEMIEEINQDCPEVSYLHSLILFSLEDFEEALIILQKYKDMYLKNENYAVFYGLLLIKNKIYVEAEALIREHLTNENSPMYLEWQQLATELTIERDLYNQEIRKKKEEIVYGLQHLEQLAFAEQVNMINRAQALDLYDLQPIAQKVLMNVHLSPLNQRAFLELLIEKNDDQEYTFYWFQKKRKITPNHLKRFEHSVAATSIQENLVNRLEKQPEYIESIYLEMIHDLLLLFPFIDEIIVEPKYWVDLYLKRFEELHYLEVDIHPRNQSQKKMLEWFSIINEFSK